MHRQSLFGNDREHFVADVVLNGQDDSLHTAGDEQKAVFVEVTEVAGVDPGLAVRMDLVDILGLFGLVFVSEHLGGAVHADLTDLVVLAFAVVLVVPDDELVDRVRETDGAKSVDRIVALRVAARISRAGRSADFGHAVAFDDFGLAAVGLDELVDVRFERVRAAVSADAKDGEVGHVEAFHLRVLEHRDEECRNSDDVSGLILLDELGPFFGLELRHDGLSGFAAHGHMHADGVTVHNNRRHGVDAVGQTLVEGLVVVVDTGNAVEGDVLQKDRLWEAGGTTGVSQSSGLGSVFLEVQRSFAVGKSLEVFVLHDHRVIVEGLVLLAGLEAVADLGETGHFVSKVEDNDLVREAGLFGSLHDLLSEEVKDEYLLGLVVLEIMDQRFVVCQAGYEVKDGTGAVGSVHELIGLHSVDGDDGDDLIFLNAELSHRDSDFFDAVEELTVSDLMTKEVKGITVKVVRVALLQIIKNGFSGNFDSVAAVDGVKVSVPRLVDRRIAGSVDCFTHSSYPP